ncbi:hypothetical protein [Sphingomonas sp. 3-13AW]|uniref:hypothetical protein n=1 Tax=Sphingomonas sp. 3-13AW TaxID=3050450 RepID=UPI003BB53EF5
MSVHPNIMKIWSPNTLRGAGVMAAGFVSMVAGLCLGSLIAEARTDRKLVEGARRDVILNIAKVGPRALRQAAIAATADGVLTTREERQLYMILDQVRLAQTRSRRFGRNGDASDTRRRERTI